MAKVFIDGQAGTTGLEIAGYLARHPGVELLQIDTAARKDPAARQDLLNSADLVVLCLPDAAAEEAVGLLQNPSTRVLDASSAHRVASAWVYGLPELCPGQREAIAQARRVSNPGCYPTGFLLSVRPLLDAGVLDPAQPLRLTGLSGYSGGGRPLIEKYQALAAQAPGAEQPSMPYGLDLHHKHVPEMHRYSGTQQPPLFVPMVAPYYKGMLVQVPLFFSELAGIDNVQQAHALFSRRYAQEPCIRVLPPQPLASLEEGKFLDPRLANDSNRLDLLLFANAEQLLLVTRYDNLGKGASGAAVQNLNLMLGFNELEGLNL